jgi:hypothetical protein
MTLYEHGIANASGSIPLFIHGASFASSGTTLYERGGLFSHEGMPLFLNTASPTDVYANAPLFINGSSHSGCFHGTTLFTFSDASGNISSRHMPLYIAAPPQWNTVRNLNLTIAGTRHQAFAGSPLFIDNGVSGIAAGSDLFIEGSGTTPGALPAYGALPLFIKRVPSSGITLTIKTHGNATTSDIPLFAAGNTILSHSAPLVMPHTIGSGNKNTTLFTHGF